MPMDPRVFRSSASTVQAELFVNVPSSYWQTQAEFMKEKKSAKHYSANCSFKQLVIVTTCVQFSYFLEFGLHNAIRSPKILWISTTDKRQRYFSNSKLFLWFSSPCSMMPHTASDTIEFSLYAAELRKGVDLLSSLII
jgi:hypothetical protein